MHQVTQLQTAGLQQWITPIVVLLHHLHGIETAMDESDGPTPDVEIARIVEEAIKQPTLDADQYLRQHLTDLAAFRIAVGAAENCARWNPLCEPFADFQRRHGRVSFWVRDRSTVETSDFLHWLDRWLC